MPTVGAPAPPPMQNMSLNEKNTAPSPAPPPAYGAPPTLSPSQAPLAHATALYAYRGEDPGDLDLQPNDLVMITEYTNAEWWTGRSERTGHTGIFPCSYVKLNEKQPMQNSTANNYGNLPLQTSGMGNGESAAPSKGQEMGKKVSPIYATSLYAIVLTSAVWQENGQRRHLWCRVCLVRRHFRIMLTRLKRDDWWQHCQ